MTRVLVVDDERDGADGLAMFFSTLGHETATAYDGAEALEVAGTFLPDVIILDIEMPLTDGFDAARLIRDRNPATAPYLIALTGLPGDDVAARTKESGFDFYMVKPADLLQLRAVVERQPQRPRPYG